VDISSATCTGNTNNGGTTTNTNTTTNNISFTDNSFNVNGNVYNNSGNTIDSNNNNVDVNGNNNTVGVNNGSGNNLVAVDSILPSDVLAAFGDNSINYYCSDSYYYYAKFCASCAIVPVEQQENGQCIYVDTTGASYEIPGYAFSTVQSATPCPGYSSAQSGIVVYQAATCQSGCSGIGSVVTSCTLCPQVTGTSSSGSGAAPAVTGAASYSTLAAAVSAISGQDHLVVSASSGEAVVTTTVACASSSIGVVAPPASITSGAVLSCQTCPAASQLVTVTPAAAVGNATAVGPHSTSSPMLFTGSAAAIKGTGALVLSILAAVMLL